MIKILSQVFDNFILGVKHGDTIASQSLARHWWLDCSDNESCVQTYCSGLSCEEDDWKTCAKNAFRIYRARGPGEVLVGDIVGIYLTSEQGMWFSCRNATCSKHSCPGVATSDNGFAKKDDWLLCYGEVFKIYARGRSFSEPIMSHDDVMLNYIHEGNWVESGYFPYKSICPGTIRPPPDEAYEYCYYNVYQIKKKPTPS